MAIGVKFRGASRLHVLLAALGLLAALAFPVEAGPAPTACGAADLLQALAKSRPDAYARIKTAAAEVKNGDGLLWRIEIPGRRPSYLFGTMHSTDPRLERAVARARPLIAGSRTVAVELGELVTPGLKEAAVARIAAAGQAGSGNALEGLWPPGNRLFVETALAGRGVPAERAQRLETWFLIVALSSPLCEQKRRALGLISVDEKIGRAAIQAGRPPIGLEKLEEQIAVMRQIGGIHPSIALIETARRSQEIADMRETMTRAYLGDRLGEMMALSRFTEIASGETQEQTRSAFTRALLDDRNAVMLERARPLIDKGGAFIAVGALHLPGEKGLVSLLRRDGYKVSVVKPGRAQGRVLR
jgi:uncharacterized protein YbaP (TraB family)